MFQLQRVSVISSDLRQEETRLYGYLPTEFEIVHNGKNIGLALDSDLGRVDTELELALIYGLASALDMANNEGSATPQQLYRMKKAELYKTRVQHRQLYRKGKMERSLTTWQV
jgi:hypothetical protein